MLTIKPGNGSNLVLSDLATLKDHYEKECMNGTVMYKLVAIVQADHYKSDKRFELDIDDSGNAYIPINPCFACEITVKAIDQNGNTNKITSKFYYNKRTNTGYPYNDQLKTEVIEKVCLMEKGRMKIPTPIVYKIAQ